MRQEAARVLVVDSGSQMTRVGFAGESTPRATFPSRVDRGTEPDYPIRNGTVVNWDALQALWQKGFQDKLQANPKGSVMLVTEVPNGPRENREQMVRFCLETLGAKALYLADEARLALLASGRRTGVVLTSGTHTTRAVPVREGVTLSEAVTQLELGGEDLTDYLAELLKETRGYGFSAGLEQVRELKEKLAFVARKDESDIDDVNYQLPGGEMLTLGDERHLCTELMFDPRRLELEQEGIHHLVYEAIQRCDSKLRPDLFANIVLEGGNTLLKGLVERLSSELRSLVPPTIDVRVTAPEDRQYSAWVGGSMLASQPGFTPLCISRPEYEEAGAKIVHRKCP
ncbi:MAG TPA: actin family protein [Myxococcaceae bacterium]|jgi:actin-related protein